MQFVTKTGLLLILLAFMAAQLPAQSAAPDDPAAKLPGPPVDRPGHGYGREMAANYENLRLLKLLESVDLTEEQSAEFIPLFHVMRKDMRTLHEEKRDIMDRLSEAVGDKENESQLRLLMDKIRKNEMALSSRQDKFLDECSAILSASQMARLIIFQETFERQILESLREYRRGRSPHSP